jgi:transcriptional regulator with XRE-family HTH domain
VSRPNAVLTRRIAEELSREDVANRVGITETQVLQIEARTSGTREATARAIARVLRADFFELFEILPGASDERALNLEPRERVSS